MRINQFIFSFRFKVLLSTFKHWRIHYLLILFLISCLASEKAKQIWYLGDEYLGPEKGHLSKIMTINPLTGQQRIVIQSKPGEGIDRAKLSPDGEHIAFTTGNIVDETSRLWFAKADGSDLRQLTEARYQISFYWLNNHNLFAVTINDRNEPPEHYQQSLYDVSTRQWQTISLVDNNPYLCGPMLSKDGEDHLIIWNGSSFTLARQRIIGANITMSPIQSFFNSANPSLESCSYNLSNQGKFVVSVRFANGPPSVHDLFLVQENNDQVKQVTDFSKDFGETKITDIAISPDSNWIVFNIWLSSPRSPTLPIGYHIALIEMNGGSLTFLNPLPPRGKYIWAPDSRFVSTSFVPLGANPDIAGGEIHLIDVKTSAITQLTFNGGTNEIVGWR